MTLFSRQPADLFLHTALTLLLLVLTLNAPIKKAGQLALTGFFVTLKT